MLSSSTPLTIFQDENSHVSVSKSNNLLAKKVLDSTKPNIGSPKKLSIRTDKTSTTNKTRRALGSITSNDLNVRTAANKGTSAPNSTQIVKPVFISSSSQSTNKPSENASLSVKQSNQLPNEEIFNDDFQEVS